MSSSVAGKEAHIGQSRPCRVQPGVGVAPLQATIEVFHPVPEERDAALNFLLGEAAAYHDYSVLLEVLQPLLVVKLE